LALAKIRTREDFDAALVRYYRDDGPGRYVPREVHGSQGET
jgi:hypothetical protein